MNARRIPICLLLSCCILLLLPVASFPQIKTTEAAAQRPTPASGHRVSLSINGGYGFLISKEGIKEFWEAGPAASAFLLIRAQSGVSFSVGVDAAQLKFRTAAFTSAFPGVPLQEPSVGYLGVSIGLRYAPFYRYRLAPYFGATVGVAKYTAASYYAIINDVRKTYYDISGTARLAAALISGVEYLISRQVSLGAEARVHYLFHDPNAGLALTVLAGARFTP